MVCNIILILKANFIKAAYDKIVYISYKIRKDTTKFFIKNTLEGFVLNNKDHIASLEVQHQQPELEKHSHFWQHDFPDIEN